MNKNLKECPDYAINHDNSYKSSSCKSELISYKHPVFEFEKQGSGSNNLGYGARGLLRLLNEYKKDEAYNLIDGRIPLDYKEIQTELDCSAEDMESYFKELEGRNLVTRCVARFVRINEQKEGEK